MSALIGRLVVSVVSSAQVLQPGQNQNDDGMQPADYRVTFPQSREGLNQYVDVLWTRSSFPTQLNAEGNGFAGLDGVHQQWEWNFPPTGGHSRKKIAGQVLDSNSAAVAGATVQVFNTATGALVSTTTSNSDGTYQGSDPNAVNCFAVGYEAGSPDTAGTTVNTVTGT